MTDSVVLESPSYTEKQEALDPPLWATEATSQTLDSLTIPHSTLSSVSSAVCTSLSLASSTSSLASHCSMIGYTSVTATGIKVSAADALISAKTCSTSTSASDVLSVSTNEITSSDENMVPADSFKKETVTCEPKELNGTTRVLEKTQETIETTNQLSQPNDKVEKETNDEKVVTEETVIKAENIEPKVEANAQSKMSEMPLDLCIAKTEMGSISFRQRSKPLVQLVYPHVHKPPSVTMAAVSLGHTETQAQHIDSVVTSIATSGTKMGSDSSTAPLSSSANISSEPAQPSISETSVLQDKPIMTTSLVTEVSNLGMVVPVHPIQQKHFGHSQNSLAQIRPAASQLPTICGNGQGTDGIQSVSVTQRRQVLDRPPPLLVMGKPPVISIQPQGMTSNKSALTVACNNDEGQLFVQQNVQVFSQEVGNIVQSSSPAVNESYFSEEQANGDSYTINKVVCTSSGHLCDNTEANDVDERIRDDDMDDEIKKQMEELDREIKRKEKEQEEMRKKKLELLQKAKQAKSSGSQQDSTTLVKTETDETNGVSKQENDTKIGIQTAGSEKNLQSSVTKSEQDNTSKIVKKTLSVMIDEMISKEISGDEGPERNRINCGSDKPIDLSSNRNQATGLAKTDLVVKTSEENHPSSSVIESLELSECSKLSGSLNNRCEENLVKTDVHFSGSKNVAKEVGEAQQDRIVESFPSHRNETASDMNNENETLDLSIKHDQEKDHKYNDFTKAVVKEPKFDKKSTEEQAAAEDEKEGSVFFTSDTLPPKSGECLTHSPSDSCTSPLHLTVSSSLPSSSTSMFHSNSNSKSSVSHVERQDETSSAVELLDLSQKANKHSRLVTDEKFVKAHPKINDKVHERSKHSDSSYTVIDLTDELRQNADIENLTQNDILDRRTDKKMNVQSTVVNPNVCAKSDEGKSSYRNKTLQELQREAIRQIQLKERSMYNESQLAMLERNPSSLQKRPVLLTNKAGPMKQLQPKSPNVRALPPALEIGGSSRRQLQNNDIKFQQRQNKDLVEEIRPAHCKSPPRKIPRNAKIRTAHRQKINTREIIEKLDLAWKEMFSVPLYIQQSCPYFRKTSPLKESPVDKSEAQKGPLLPAHNQGPFCIAGHLIQKRGKKRKRTSSADVLSLPKFYSLPNTPSPISESVMLTRANSLSDDTAGKHSSPVPQTLEPQVFPSVTSPGPQQNVPLSPVRAHWTPPLSSKGGSISTTKFMHPLSYENINFSKTDDVAINDLIDLTKVSDDARNEKVAARNLELQHNDTEKAVQQELSEAIAKRQKTDNDNVTLQHNGIKAQLESPKRRRDRRRVRPILQTNDMSILDGPFALRDGGNMGVSNGGILQPGYPGPGFHPHLQMTPRPRGRMPNCKQARSMDINSAVINQQQLALQAQSVSRFTQNLPAPPPLNSPENRSEQSQQHQLSPVQLPRQEGPQRCTGPLQQKHFDDRPVDLHQQQPHPNHHHDHPQRQQHPNQGQRGHPGPHLEMPDHRIPLATEEYMSHLPQQPPAKTHMIDAAFRPGLTRMQSHQVRRHPHPDLLRMTSPENPQLPHPDMMTVQGPNRMPYYLTGQSGQHQVDRQQCFPPQSLQSPPLSMRMPAPPSYMGVVGHPGQELPHDQQIRMQQVRAHHIHQVQARNQLRAMSLPHGARPPVSVQQETRQTVYHQMPHTSQPHGSYSQTPEMENRPHVRHPVPPSPQQQTTLTSTHQMSALSQVMPHPSCVLAERHGPYPQTSQMPGHPLVVVTTACQKPALDNGPHNQQVYPQGPLIQTQPVLMSPNGYQNQQVQTYPNPMGPQLSGRGEHTNLAQPTSISQGHPKGMIYLQQESNKPVLSQSPAQTNQFPQQNNQIQTLPNNLSPNQQPPHMRHQANQNLLINQNVPQATGKQSHSPYHGAANQTLHPPHGATNHHPPPHETVNQKLPYHGTPNQYLAPPGIATQNFPLPHGPMIGPDQLMEIAPGTLIPLQAIPVPHQQNPMHGTGQRMRQFPRLLPKNAEIQKGEPGHNNAPVSNIHGSREPSPAKSSKTSDYSPSRQNQGNVKIPQEAQTVSVSPVKQSTAQSHSLTTNKPNKQPVKQKQGLLNETLQSGSVKGKNIPSESTENYRKNSNETIEKQGVKEESGPIEIIEDDIDTKDAVKMDVDMPHLQQIHGRCVLCGKYSLYLCSSCKKIWYCSPKCQLTHWQTHAMDCEGQT